VKLAQRHNNPDAFDLYFYSNVDSYVDEVATYVIGGTYTADRISVFGRSDFEDFPESSAQFQSRLDEFSRLLLSGRLRKAKFE